MPKANDFQSAREEYVGRDNLVKYTQPYPVILDTNLRCTVDVSLIKHAATKETLLPMIFTTVDRNDEEHNGRWVGSVKMGCKQCGLLIAHLTSVSSRMLEPKSTLSIGMPMVKSCLNLFRYLNSKFLIWFDIRPCESFCST